MGEIKNSDVMHMDLENPYVVVEQIRLLLEKEVFGMRMKNRRLKTIVSFILAMVIICTSSIESFAIVKGEDSFDITINAETIMEMDGTRIDYYETSEGDRVFLQYVNDILTQKNILPHDENNIVLREFYDRNSTIIKTDTLNIDDYITVSKVEQQSYDTNATVSKGTIKYSTILDTGKYNYGIKCTYTTKDDTTTYTINKYKGALVDLVALVVGATNFIQKYATAFIKSILISAGISLVAGVIKSALTTTISCDRRVYKWKLVNTKNTAHFKYVYGYRYKANDSKYDCDDTFYEGYLPKDWKTSALAIHFHNELFTYSVFTVEGWS